MKWKKRVILELGEDTGLYLIDDFLSHEECDTLIAYAKEQGMKYARAFKPRPGEKAHKFHRASFLDEAFSHDATPTLKKIHRRVEELTCIPTEHGEKVKIICYEKGPGHAAHTDYIPVKNRKKQSARVAQMLFYLSDVEEGGETYFNTIGIKVVPKKGRAILWYGIKDLFLPKGKNRKFILPKSFRMNEWAIHQPMEIKKGEKWIISKILHHLPFIQPPPSPGNF